MVTEKENARRQALAERMRTLKAAVLPGVYEKLFGENLLRDWAKLKARSTFFQYKPKTKSALKTIGMIK